VGLVGRWAGGPRGTTGSERGVPSPTGADIGRKDATKSPATRSSFRLATNLVPLTLGSSDPWPGSRLPIWPADPRKSPPRDYKPNASGRYPPPSGLSPTGNRPALKTSNFWRIMLRPKNILLLKLGVRERWQLENKFWNWF
jgi:hypothetical protein